MRITKFWARGYRSLKDVTLDPLGPFNIFYGPNGSGKSNVLAAIEALSRCVRLLADDSHASLLNVNARDGEAYKARAREAGAAVVRAGVISSRDFAIDLSPRTLSIGAAVAVEGDAWSVAGQAVTEVVVEVTFDEIVPDQFRLSASELSMNGRSTPGLFTELRGGIDACRAALDDLSRAFWLLDAVRAPRFETTVAPARDGEDPVLAHLREGRLKNALFVAQNSPDASVRARFRALHQLLEGEPLRRPHFDVVQHQATQEVDVREPLGKSDVPLDRFGLGVAQVYALLAGVLLSNGRAVAIEEPEAHLHAPTLGRALRALLRRLVDEGILDQLFIATHSNLFDLDPDGYWDVSMVDGETRVVRKPLHEIDRHHLWETGPTRHALMLMLRYAPADKVVFAHADGRPITAGQMLQYLRDDDNVTKRFLGNLHGAALDMMRIASDREPEP